MRQCYSATATATELSSRQINGPEHLVTAVLTLRPIHRTVYALLQHRTVVPCTAGNDAQTLNMTHESCTNARYISSCGSVSCIEVFINLQLLLGSSPSFTHASNLSSELLFMCVQAFSQLDHFLYPMNTLFTGTLQRLSRTCV